MLELLYGFIIALLIVVVFMPGTIRSLKEKHITGTDVHKPDRPEIPKGGGFVVLFAVVASTLLIVGVTTIESGAVTPGLLAALVSVLMAGMIGLLDDSLDFRNRTKVILPLVASIPMMAMQVGTSTIYVPFIGVLNLGIVYPLVVVPLMMTFIIDSTNMYAGMNGLEASLTSVNTSAIVMFLVLRAIVNNNLMTEGQLDAGIIAAALLGASLGFLIFNRYPAKILPGDVGNLSMGAATAAALILGNMDRLAFFLFTPFMVNFLLYLVYRWHVKKSNGKWEKFAKPREDGTLEVIGPYTMYWLLPSISNRITEKKNVIALAVIQAIIAYGVVLYLVFG